MRGSGPDQPDQQLTPEQRWALQSMGVTLWKSKGQSKDLPNSQSEHESRFAQSDAPPQLESPTPEPPAPATTSTVETEPPVAELRVPTEGPASDPEPEHGPEDVSSMDWAGLRDAVDRCTRCPLHQTRTQGVFGVGAEDADWMIIGEAPGADEDRRGEPFVGRAGKLLDELLSSMALDRSSVFIANILKSRPPENRDPGPDEVAACVPFLERQIELVRPSLILAVGAVAAQNLLITRDPVGRLRGKVHAYGRDAIPLVVTYHPSYLLRQPSAKGKVWQDLKLARRTAMAGLK